jgi:protein associated with RNAse G/E
MIKLRSKIKSKLKTYHDRVYFHKAPAKAQMPYVVFDFPNSFDNEQQEIFNLDVDIWDDKDDTTALETLASSLWKGLNYYRYTDADIQFSIYRENRLPTLDEEEINIKRRKLIFSLRYFDRRLFE